VVEIGSLLTRDLIIAQRKLGYDVIVVSIFRIAGVSFESRLRLERDAKKWVPVFR